MKVIIPILNFLGLIASVFGVISKFILPASFPTIILISAIICVLEAIINYLFGELNGFQIDITAIVIGVIVALVFHFDLRNSICVAICIKHIVINILPWILIFKG